MAERVKACIYNPAGVLCTSAEIKDNKCKICGWNPEVYKKRVIELKTKYGKKG